MSESLVRSKAENFAIRIVRCSRHIKDNCKEYSMADQLLRSGTSIGANLYEGMYAQSRADFISKYSISLKEASGTGFWLNLLHKTNCIDDKIYDSMNGDVQEIIRLLISIIKTSKKNKSQVF